MYEYKMHLHCAFMFILWISICNLYQDLSIIPELHWERYWGGLCALCDLIRICDFYGRYTNTKSGDVDVYFSVSGDLSNLGDIK